MDCLTKILWKIDNIYFVLNIDNSHTLQFGGNTTVKYVEVVFGGDSITMVIRISGG